MRPAMCSRDLRWIEITKEVSTKQARKFRRMSRIDNRHFTRNMKDCTKRLERISKGRLKNSKSKTRRAWLTGTTNLWSQLTSKWLTRVSSIKLWATKPRCLLLPKLHQESQTLIWITINLSSTTLLFQTSILAWRKLSDHKIRYHDSLIFSSTHSIKLLKIFSAVWGFGVLGFWGFGFRV